MAGFFAVFLSLGVCWNANAQRLFVDGFEDPFIAALFPKVNGDFQLPSGPAVNQLNWVLGKLLQSSAPLDDLSQPTITSGELAQPTTTLSEITDHFSSGWDPAAASSFLNSLKTSYPDARVVEVVSITPISLRVVIQSGDGTSELGFLTLEIDWTENKKIGYFTVHTIGNVGGLKYPAHQTMTMSQAADAFQALSSANSILIARINSQGQCVPVVARNASTPRGTGSIFKMWVLGGIAEMLSSGAANPNQSVSLVASEVVAGSGLANIPLGTAFNLADMSILMMGISDNTATDHLHELAGRSRLNQFVQNSGVADPDVLIPLLSINEQFHLFYSVNLTSALSFINGTEPFQASYVQNTLVPLGPTMGNVGFNKQLLSTGSWQASPTDVCQVMAKLRQYPDGSVAKNVVNQAFGAQARQPFVRNEWDRVWYKGGELAEEPYKWHVYTHAWMLENAGEDAWAVVAMANDPNAGIVYSTVNQIQSLTSRILQLAAQ